MARLTLRAAWARALSATILRSGPFIAQRVARSFAGSCPAGLPPSATMRAADSMTRAGTQSSAKPRRFAFFASTLLPVSIRSSAAAGPISVRQAQHAAPAGDDAEHDLGQRELRARLVDHDAVAAGERELQAAAHAVAADQRQRRVGHARRGG
ncbi:hypothetical protein MASR2M50_32480 [Thauera sp.]